MKTRRDFISSLSAAIAGIGCFTILPGAGRIWRAERGSLYRWPPNDHCEIIYHNAVVIDTMIFNGKRWEFTWKIKRFDPTRTVIPYNKEIHG